MQRRTGGRNSCPGGPAHLQLRLELDAHGPGPSTQLRLLGPRQLPAAPAPPRPSGPPSSTCACSNPGRKYGGHTAGWRCLAYPWTFCMSASFGAQKVVHVHPRDAIWDAGWGYVAALGSAATIAETVLSSAWILPPHARIRGKLEYVTKRPRPFLRGNVFVAPAALVGIQTRTDQSAVEMLTALAGGARLDMADNARAALTVMHVDMPYLEHMSATRTCRKFLADHADDVNRLRVALAS